jgi:membrane protease YdiL (CAAX protease family)
MHRNPTARARAYASTLNRLGWALVVFFVAVYVFTFSSEFIIKGMELTENDVIIGLTKGIVSPFSYMAPFFLGGIFFYLFSRKKETQRILYEVKLPAYFPLLIFAGFAIITASSYVNSMICQLIGYSMPEELFNQTYDNPYAVIAYMATALAPAFAEEFLFRGVVYGNLRPFGRTQAILISAALFALMHQNIGQIFYTFMAGIVMALMYELTGSIWCGVLYHMINNQMSVIVQYLYYGLYGESISALLTAWDIITCILGIGAILVLVFYFKHKKHAYVAAATEREVLPPWAIRKGLLAPGILVFSIATVLSMALTYLMITLLY